MRLRSIGLFAVLALVFVSCGVGIPEGSGPTEGIQVHGDWTIDVYNEDGSLDRHVAFSNDLTGASAVARILAGELVVSSWIIEVASADSIPPCPTGGAVPGCPVGGDLVTASANAGVLSASGTQTATRDGGIGSVATHVVVCPPVGCGTGLPPSDLEVLEVTATDVVDPATSVEYAITEGQTFDVNVDISFTSG